MSRFKKRNDFLKLLAIVSMTIDHIGFVFSPQIIAFRLIGRLAFPVFAWSAAQGYIYTSNLRNYLKRLFIFALVSQIPYLLIINPESLNIIFTLILGIVLIYLVDKKYYYFTFLILALTYFVPVDYGLYGVLLVFFFWWLRKLEIYSFFIQSLISFIYYQFILILSVFTSLGIALVLYFPQDKVKIHLPKHIFYWFYPVHLLIIYFLNLLI